MNINEKIKEIAEKEIQILLNKLELNCSESSQSLIGSKPLAANTIKAYQKHIRGIEKFCMLIGDYHSLLILLEKPPEPFVPAMSPETISYYIHFKRWKRDTALKNIISNQPILDIFGNPILCEGSWKDPKNVDQFIAAIGTIHAARGHREQFFESCASCIEDEQNLGCRFHRGNPLLWRRGNPKNCSLLENVISKNTKVGSGYVAKGDSPLTPWEIADMRECLVNSNNLFDLQLYVMILLSIKLFLREEELASIKIESFNEDLFVISSTGFVEGLSLFIQGKSDKQPVTLMIWTDHEIPNLCPVRHLLVYLHEANIKNGYIFPSRKKSGEQTSDDPISYETYNEAFKTLCATFVKREGRYGSHSCRKTGYLFAVWGKGEDSDIMLSARHKTLSSAMKYKRDATFLLNLAKMNNRSLVGLVSGWKPIYCQDLQLSRSINYISNEFSKNITDLANSFVASLEAQATGVSWTLKTKIAKASLIRKENGPIENIKSICLQYLNQETSDVLLSNVERYALMCRYQGSNELTL